MPTWSAPLLSITRFLLKYFLKGKRTVVNCPPSPFKNRVFHATAAREKKRLKRPNWITVDPKNLNPSAPNILRFTAVSVPLRFCNPKWLHDRKRTRFLKGNGGQFTAVRLPLRKYLRRNRVTDKSGADHVGMVSRRNSNGRGIRFIDNSKK